MEHSVSSTMGPASRKWTAGICSNDSGEVHGPPVPAADLPSPLSPRPVNALAPAFDALARPAAGRPSKFDYRQLVDSSGIPSMSGSGDKLSARGAARRIDASRRQFLKGTAATAAVAST